MKLRVGSTATYILLLSLWWLELNVSPTEREERDRDFIIDCLANSQYNAYCNLSAIKVHFLVIGLSQKEFCANVSISNKIYLEHSFVQSNLVHVLASVWHLLSSQCIFLKDLAKFSSINVKVNISLKNSNESSNYIDS